MLEVAREAVAARGEAEVADAIVRVSATLIGADQGTLGLVQGDEVLTIAALIPPRQPVGSRFPVGFGVAGWVAATGRPAEIQDVRQDKRYVALPYPEVRSFVGMPLSSGGELVGVLSLAAWRQGAFAANTAEALAPFTEHAALLLRQAIALRKQRERLHELETTSRDELAESLHELKSPLHAAAGFLDLVADEQAGPLNEQQKDFLNTARAECARLREALALLVEVGAQRPMQMTLLDPAQIVSESVERFRGQALGRSVQLVARVDDGAQPVMGDAPALQQVLANFVQNSLRLVPAGSAIEVSAERGIDGTGFAVADRGPGLPDGDVFARFAQGSRHRQAGNVGLGLSLAKKIVEQHHGRIWAENRRDGGTKLCFVLPAAT